MKSVKFLLAALALVIGFSATAQDFSDPKFAIWGETPEERQANIEASNYLKEALDAKDFKRATEYFQQLLNSCPKASQLLIVKTPKIFPYTGIHSNNSSPVKPCSSIFLTKH